MLGQFEGDYWSGEWQGPVETLWQGPMPPADEAGYYEATVPEFTFEELWGPEGGNPFDAYATVGPDISYGQYVPLPEVGNVDVFSGMFDSIQLPTFEQWNTFTEPGAEEGEGFLSKLWGGIKEFAGGLQFGGSGGVGGGIAPNAPGSIIYPQSGSQSGGGINLGTVALLAGGAAVLFALTRGKK